MQIITVLGLLFALSACLWLPHESYAVLNNSTSSMHCYAQNHVELIMERCMSDLQDTVLRNAKMLRTGTVPHPC